jgi:hypothetical protein
MSDETNQNKNEKFVVLDPADVDYDKIVWKDAKSFTFGAGVKNTNSSAFYLNDDGEECELYIKAPKQQIFGVSYKYDMNLGRKLDDPDDPSLAKGLQVAYPLTSLQTIKNPTPEEQAFADCLERLWQSTVDIGMEELKKKPLGVPAYVKASYMGAEGDMRNFIKYPAAVPKQEDKSKGDKPLRMYVNLISTGSGETMSVTTKFYEPGDKQVSPLKFIKKLGTIEPCFKFEGAYWGTHGTENSQGGSLRFKLAQANFFPGGNRNAVPNARLLPRNTAPAEDDTPSVAHNDDAPPSSSAIPHPQKRAIRPAPSGDDANPMQTLLTKKPATKPAAAKPVVKTTVAAKPVVKAATSSGAGTVKKPVLVKKPVAQAPKLKVKPAPVPSPEEPEETEQEAEEPDVQEDENE